MRGMLRGWLELIEARIEDARRRGLFTRSAERGPVEDPLAGLPADARMDARIAASVGGAPPEVDRMREVRELREAIERAPDPATQAALRRRLRDAEIERNVLLEKTGRAVLLTSMLEGTGADAPPGQPEPRK